MVESIGAKPVTPGPARVAAVGRARAALPVQTSPEGETQAAGLQGAARALAATPPVDLDRVARIRKAIADGTFPISPATVADRLIAFKLDWNPDEPQHGSRHDQA